MARPRSDARKGEAPIRITTAATSRSEDIAHRQKVYLLSMSIRSACFIGAVFAGVNHVTWLWPTLIAAALILPYIAVVMANAARTRGDDFALLDSPYGRPQLGPGVPTDAPTDAATAPTGDDPDVAGAAEAPTADQEEGQARVPDICSAKGCTAPALWELQWNNPKIHAPDRRKVWLACDEHRQSLTDFLTARGFLKDVLQH